VQPRENVSDTPNELVIVKMDGRKTPVDDEFDAIKTEYETVLAPEQVSV
jgi:hypothetical protein